MFSINFGRPESSLPISLLLATSLLLSACGQVGTKAPVEDKTGGTGWSTGSLKADHLIEGLSPESAIEVLLETANSRFGEAAFALRQQALALSLANESSLITTQRLDDISALHPQPAYAVRLALLRQRILLSKNRPQEVLGNLDRLSQRATPTERLHIKNLKADALQLAGFPIESIQLRIELDRAYSNRLGLQRENDLRLWHNLSQVSSNLISRHISEIPDTLSGWLELAYISKQYPYNTTQLNEAIAQWQTRHTQHPANRHIIPSIKERQIATSRHPEHIALILPLSGKLANAGQAIRDGFIGSYLQANRYLGLRLRIDIYDTGGTAELAQLAIKQAQQAGARFIVGPLHKAAIKGVLDTMYPEATLDASGNQTNQPSGPFPPMLVLNQIDDSTNLNIDSDIYQFALTPETEARQAAERASLDGHQYAMVMVPQNVWGNRLYEAFVTRYRELGGNVIAEYRFPRGTNNYSQGIQKGVNLNQSQLRHRQIKQLLNEDIEFTPRIRQDMDMIFMAASASDARQIKPQLRFFYADKIPVYATSHVFSGDTEPARDKDLNGIVFTDMPWTLNEKPAPGSLKKIINDNWPKSSARYGRFYALGADALLLLPQLAWLNEHPGEQINAHTGRLSVDNYSVKRLSSWGIFHNGVPVTAQ